MSRSRFVVELYDDAVASAAVPTQPGSRPGRLPACESNFMVG